MIPARTTHPYRTEAQKRAISDCLWEQDGGPRCQPTDKVMCLPCWKRFHPGQQPKR